MAGHAERLVSGYMGYYESVRNDAGGMHFAHHRGMVSVMLKLTPVSRIRMFGMYAVIYGCLSFVMNFGSRLCIMLGRLVF